jgi:hypothetical protein
MIVVVAVMLFCTGLVVKIKFCSRQKVGDTSTSSSTSHTSSVKTDHVNNPVGRDADFDTHHVVITCATVVPKSHIKNVGTMELNAGRKRNPRTRG